jgi:hypothetical protein
MARGHRVKPGDVFAIPLAGCGVVAALVLHVSRVFRRGMIAGAYDTLFSRIEDINTDDLDSPFIDTPNYTSVIPVKEGDWPVVGHSEEVLSRATLPVLRASYHLFLGDEEVGQLAPADLPAYPTLTLIGKVYFENRLRRHYEGRNARPGGPKGSSPSQ